MEKTHRMSKSEKELLNLIGSYPEMSVRELLSKTPYKRVSTVTRKIEKFKRIHLLFGPSYGISYDILCRNPLHTMYCILETHRSLETLISYLTLIEPLTWIFPVLSPYKKVVTVGITSSDNAEVTALLQLLKDNAIISDFVVRTARGKRFIANPDLFGDPNPPLDTLLELRELPDVSQDPHDTAWDACDLSILPYLESGWKGAKLIEILKEERRLQRDWTYEQIKASYEKMLKNGLIRRIFAVLPYPSSRCAYFIVFLKAGDTTLTWSVVANFARGGRVYKEYALCEEWGMLICFSHHHFLLDLMYKLDKVEEICEKELYQIRSIPSREYTLSRPMEFKYFDFEKQTLEYPYRLYKERMKAKLESEEI